MLSKIELQAQNDRLNQENKLLQLALDAAMDHIVLTKSFLKPNDDFVRIGHFDYQGVGITAYLIASRRADGGTVVIVQHVHGQKPMRNVFRLEELRQTIEIMNHPSHLEYGGRLKTLIGQVIERQKSILKSSQPGNVTQP